MNSNSSTDTGLKKEDSSTSKKTQEDASRADPQKITNFFPVLRAEGRAKMCAIKPGDSKQKEILQKLKSKEPMSLRPKNQDNKPAPEQSNKIDLSSNQNKEKIRNISVLAALKTPLSQVLRKSIEASENKKDVEKLDVASEKASSQGETVSNQGKKEAPTKEVIEPAVQTQKAKKSIPEGEGGMLLRRSQKPHSTKTFTTTLRLSTISKKTNDASQNSVQNTRRKVVALESSEVAASKNSLGGKILSANIPSSSVADEGSNSGKAKKGRKRHFRGSTYGLYLTPAKKKKKKQKSSPDESRDDECSLAGTENSSYLDSEDGNSLVSDDFYTPSEKSLADEDHCPDSRNSPMLSTNEQKSGQLESNAESNPTSNLVSEVQGESCETGEQNIKNEEGASNSAILADCDEISQNASDMLQQLGDMQWETNNKFDEVSEENQFPAETLKAPLYDDISNESFSNSTLFPFKECSVENGEGDNTKEVEMHVPEKTEEQDLGDTINVVDVSDKPESQELISEISETCVSIDENFANLFETKEESDSVIDPELKNSPDTEINSPEHQNEDTIVNVDPVVEKPEVKEKDPSDTHSTIATCVKSRQRIKRRFTDDIVDTDVGLLSLNSMPAASRKVPARPDPPKDIIENFQSVTRSEAKKGSATKIECIFNSHQKPVKTCTCEGETYEAKLGTDDDGIFCQAVDSIDDKLVGCSNPVVTTRLVRSSVKIPFTIMCEMHLWRLRHHHSCPYCGLFCSQGYFMQCTSGKSKQKIVHLYHEQCQSKEEGHIPFCLHCGVTTGLKRVQLEMHMASPPSFFLSQLPGLPVPDVSKARISYSATSEFFKKEEEDSPHLTYTIEETSKVLSSSGLPKGSQQEELDKLLQMLNDETANTYYFTEDMYAVAGKGDVLKVLHLLAQGFDPNQKFSDHENETALHAAAANGHTIICHLLIQAGAVVDSLNERICTPLMVAVEKDHKDVVHYLVKKGSLVDFKGENGMSSLHLAAKNGRLEILKILMTSRDVDVNSQDDGGWTPIVWASEHDHYNVVKYLLKRGANPNIKDSEGNTGLHWSAFSGSADICYLYLDYGCDLNAVNELGDTPLHIAARQDNFPCVTLFLSRGADVQIKNKAQLIPAECCIDKNSDTYLSLSLNMLLKKITGKYQHKAEKILHRDISRGKEQISIQCVNAVDDELPPLDFLYVTENCETMPIKIDRTITSLQSCHCEDDCSTASCSCSSISYQCWYDKEGLLLPDFNLIDPPMLFECNRACSCWSLNCHNRVLQNGITCRLQLIRTKGKGWGVRTLKDIPKGAFICEYVGELISDSAADKRADDSYLFDLDNRDGETYCLDARYYGNISRFINHLCEPNLVPVKVYVDHQDLNFPRIAFFSSREIKQYEELGFDYGEKFWAIKYKFFTCDCGTPKCKYSKDTIHTTIANYYRRLKEEQMEEAAAQQPVVQTE